MAKKEEAATPPQPPVMKCLNQYILRSNPKTVYLCRCRRQEGVFAGNRLRWRIPYSKRPRGTIAPFLDDRMPTHVVPVRASNRPQHNGRWWLSTAER